MISPKDVITMRVPYPSISSGLVLRSHMYICYINDNLYYEFIKCQTIKPYMLSNNPICNFHDEKPDIKRNPFKNKTRIDCDKIFSTKSVSYDDRLKANSRPDICDDLFSELQKKIHANTPVVIPINESELKSSNPLIC